MKKLTVLTFIENLGNFILKENPPRLPFVNKENKQYARVNGMYGNHLERKSFYGMGPNDIGSDSCRSANHSSQNRLNCGHDTIQRILEEVGYRKMWVNCSELLTIFELNCIYL